MIAKEYLGYMFYEDGTVWSPKGKEIKKRVHKGRYEVSLRLDDKRKQLLFHRVWYYLFVEQFDIANKNLCVSARDGNFTNITKDNLFLAHRKDLIQGDKHKVSKLTDEMVREIREIYNGKVGTNQHDKVGLSYNDLAKRYNVTKGAIARIMRKECRDDGQYKLK